MSNLSILDLIKVYIGFMKASTFILFFSERSEFPGQLPYNLFLIAQKWLRGVLNELLLAIKKHKY
ncbi:hypothetical protein CHCC20373_4561 [Bacillus licheniformis]|nr:hypothetical protein CHCC20373_4561 [Bacillus licheniformis]TWK75464.1 hypothetical protein CHCC20339_1100 [Bacillus licheniformis]